MDADAEAALIKRTTAAAYRQVAGWIGNPGEAGLAASIADQVEAFDGTAACCPCCQETTCDDGCPLAPLRTEG